MPIRTILGRSILISILAVSFLSMGCAKKAEAPAENTAPAAKTAAKPEKILNVNLWNDPEAIDPSMISGSYGSQVAGNLFEGLFWIDSQTGAPAPALATSWELSKDRKTYTFQLRKDAKWSDGKLITAHDFVYSWTRSLDPATGGKYAFFLYYVKNAKAFNKGELTDATQLGVKALSDYALQVELESPTPFFFSLLTYSTFGPLPRWAIEQHGVNWTKPANIVTNGPFHLTDRVLQSYLLLEKRADYWDADNVLVDGVRFHTVEDKETALKMYHAGDMHINWRLPEAKVPALLSHPDMLDLAYNANYYLNLNTRKGPLSDVRVRRALTMAIDRDTMMNKYLQGVVQPWGGLVPGGMPEYENPKGIAFDPAQAKALFAEAGYGEGGKPFPKLTISYNTDERHKLIGQVVQQMWKQHLGIDVELLNQEWKSYIKALKAGDFDIGRISWRGDYMDPNTFLEYFIKDNMMNFPGWHSDAYLALLDKAMKQEKHAERMQILAEAEALLLSEAPVIPLYIDKLPTLVKPEVQGYHGNLLNYQVFKGVSLAEK